MAGIYIHIPLCSSRCIYCDFYSTTQVERAGDYISALLLEYRMRKGELGGEPIYTLYIGGGTPSQLTTSELARLFEGLGDLSLCREITLECNPDDLTAEYVAALAHLPINRISMGIQSFDDEALRLLRRRHTAQEAIEAVQRCQQAGITNLSVDLIYGLPGQNMERWNETLQQAISLQVPHLSAYHLTYEQGTPLALMLRRGEVQEVDEAVSIDMLECTIDRLTEVGYEHYEISNFARPGCYSQHNTAYWQGVPYLGLGASAHSYTQGGRSNNVADMRAYMEAVTNKMPYITREVCGCNDRYNDFVITSLRTKWGISLSALEVHYPAYHTYCLAQAAPYISEGLLLLDKNTLTLSRRGIFISDRIMSDLLYVSE